MAAEARRQAHISHVSVGSSNVAPATTAVRCPGDPSVPPNLTRASNLTVPLRLFVEPSCREGGDGAFLTRILRRAHGRRLLCDSLPRQFGGARPASATASVAIRPQVPPALLGADEDSAELTPRSYKVVHGDATLKLNPEGRTLASGKLKSKAGNRKWEQRPARLRIFRVRFHPRKSCPRPVHNE